MGILSNCNLRASHCSGFSCCKVWALGAQASVAMAGGLSSWGSQALEHRLNSCVWASLLCGMWDLPGPGIKPVSLALAGRFFTTEPPGEPVAAFSAIHFYEPCKTKISLLERWLSVSISWVKRGLNVKEFLIHLEHFNQVANPVGIWRLYHQREWDCIFKFLIPSLNILYWLL